MTKQALRKRRPPAHWAQWGALVLRRRREGLGLTREVLAQQTGLVSATIRNLERGKVRNPDAMTVRLLCGALSLPVPGEEGLYLSIAGVPADRLCSITRDALSEYALRRREPKRFVAAVAPNQTRQQVMRDRDLALRLHDLLRGAATF